MADFPVEKETFPTWENKDLGLSKLGSVVDADVLNHVYRLLERIQDALGVSFISGYSSLKDRLDSVVGARIVLFYSVTPGASYSKYIGLGIENANWGKISPMWYENGWEITTLYARAKSEVAVGSSAEFRIYKDGNNTGKIVTITPISGGTVVFLNDVAVDVDEGTFIDLRCATGGTDPAQDMFAGIVLEKK